MYSVVVMPLSEFLAGEDDDFELGAELVEIFQETLTEEVGRQVIWDEEPVESAEEDEVDEEALWALRVAAAWYEVHGTLEGCEPGDSPWDHPILDQISEQEGSVQFKQLLHTEVDVLGYVPVDLPDVFFLAPETEEEETRSAAAGEDDGEDEPEEGEIGIGSLPALVEELEALREPLGLPEALEDIAVEEFVDDPDIPLSSAKFAWYVLRDCAREAEEAQLPLMIFWVEAGDEDEE
jgi:hypothetical protein